MPTVPTVTVRIAWVTDPLAVTPTWVDVSSVVREIHIKRGRKYETDKMEAGTATLLIDNRSGNYWPDNPVGSYYGYVMPGRKVNVRATYGGTTYDLFTGYIESFTPSWSGKAQIGPLMTIKCTDGLLLLSKLILNDGAGYPQELSGARVTRILNDMSFPAADRLIDTGDLQMQASGALVDVNALEHLNLVQDTELGTFYFRGDGYAIWEDKSHRTEGVHIAPQAIFGDGIGEMKFVDIGLSFDDSYIDNQIMITRIGGTQQSVTDSTSVAKFGKRGRFRTGLLHTSDPIVLTQVQYLASQRHSPTLRAESITLLPGIDPANLFPKALGYDISTRIEVKLTAPCLDREYHIEGIRHDYVAKSQKWETTWQLSNPETNITFNASDAMYYEATSNVYATAHDAAAADAAHDAQLSVYMGQRIAAVAPPNDITIERVGFDFNISSIPAGATIVDAALELVETMTIPATINLLTDFLPTGAGDYTALTPAPGGGEANWQDVDDPVGVPDDDTTYVVEAGAGPTKDAYALANHTTEKGYITAVQVYYRVKQHAATQGYARPYLRLGGVETTGTRYTIPAAGTWYTQHETLARPGGGQWDWEDIDALQVAIGLEYARCTQIYVEVIWQDPPELDVVVVDGTGIHNPAVVGDYHVLLLATTPWAAWNKMIFSYWPGVLPYNKQRLFFNAAGLAGVAAACGGHIYLGVRSDRDIDNLFPTEGEGAGDERMCFLGMLSARLIVHWYKT